MLLLLDGTTTSVALTCSVEEAPVRCDRCRVQTDWKTNTDKGRVERSHSSVFNMRCDMRSLPDTVSIVLSQWLLYAANFLNVLQLTAYHWSHQLHICMEHSHSPTKQMKKKKSHTISHHGSRTSVSKHAWTDAQVPMTSAALHNCFFWFCFVFFFTFLYVVLFFTLCCHGCWVKKPLGEL